VLPEEVLRLPAELDRVDDPVSFGPFTPFVDPRLGGHPPRRGVSKINCPCTPEARAHRLWGT
jgi:hypothetical protein